jgi:FlaA1/EpsC-like NDP-sugar epimerase
VSGARGQGAPLGLTITARQAQFASWSMYLLIDIVVLNLFVEFTDSVVIDSFYISMLTAVLLRLLLGATLGLERRVSRYFDTKSFQAAGALKFVCIYLILFASKFVILEVVDVVFGDHVSLGGFFEIVAIAVTLLLAERAFRTVFERLGGDQADVGERVV